MEDDKKKYRTHTVAEKKELVRKFNNSKKNMSAFARENNIDRKALARMIRDYSDIVAEEDKLKEKALKTISDDTADSYMVQIPIVEYQEMQNKLFKYEMIINTLNQCI
jgi:transposase-like protein